MRELLVQRLGLVDYESALAIQKKTETDVKTGIQPDTLLLLEHPHTLTIGRRGDSSSILLDQEQVLSSGEVKELQGLKVTGRALKAVQAQAEADDEEETALLTSGSSA